MIALFENFACGFGFGFLGVACVLALGHVIWSAGRLWRWLQSRRQPDTSPICDIPEEP